jgi:tetrahydromethanopterin S-methyltransferase subunit B
MQVNFDQEKLERAVINAAVDELLGNDIGPRVSQEVENQVSAAVQKALSIRLDSTIEKTINDIMERALDEEIHPVNTWGEREGKPTTIRGALHDRAKAFWAEKVDKEGKKSAYGGQPRYEHVIGIIAAKEFESAVKAEIVNIAGAVKDSVRKGMREKVDEHLDALFKVKSIGDQRVKGKT